ncbi:acetyl-CoA carboxylase carboxyl transferase subunit alpha [Bacillus piscicola]|uniref:acetyl-CoA carboxylase carboxyl transferase subunit alpha n=1 Tax=Bacillus piscicola TaxID=1632684 RepID=UPI001F089081|nr:acetyl-CoA carboxylase carboxyl transferase subunit alpha [Bacillus piscicola]
MQRYLPFEKPVMELHDKIAELKRFASEKELDLDGEISKLEARLSQLENDIYANLTPWQRVQIARHSERPTTLDYIGCLFTDFIELHGDRLYGDDAAIVSGIAKYKGKPVTVIGHQRGKDTKENIKRNFGMPHPEGYRKALRLMKQAEKFSRPVICFIDTKGAYPGKAAEERGQSEAIARNLLEMAGLNVPIISIVIGEGGSGGALALGLGNHIHMLEYSTYSVISPEGAAALLWKDASFAKQAAETMRITAPDLKELGVIDEIIKEARGGAHKDVKQQAHLIDEVLERSLDTLQKRTSAELKDERYEKFKQIGSRSASEISGEINEVT